MTVSTVVRKWANLNVSVRAEPYLKIGFGSGSSVEPRVSERLVRAEAGMCIASLFPPVFYYTI